MVGCCISHPLPSCCRHHHHHLRFHYCFVTSSSIPLASSRSTPSRRCLLFLLVLSLFLFLLCSIVPRCSFSSLSSAKRRRPDEHDNSSSIRLSIASLFGPLPIMFFLLLSALREDFGALSAKGEQALIAASIRSDALERRVNLLQRSLILTRRGMR